MPGELARQVPALASTSAAYGFLLRNIAVLVRLLLLPIAAIAAVLYFSIRAYLSELVVFIASGDPRAASVALAAITACTLLTLFCASVAVSSVVNLALGRPLRGTGLQFRTGRQEWRLYAAYLRFLLVITAFLSADYIFAAQLLPLLIASAAIATAAGIAIGVVGIVALLAGVGFLLPIIVARSQGTVLRKALREGLHDFWQNCLLVVLLAIPGLAIEILSEYVVRWGTLSPRVLVNYPLANYARALENELPRFVVVASISAFVTIVLFASGSVFHYRNRRFAGSEQRTTEQPLPNLDSAPV